MHYHVRILGLDSYLRQQNSLHSPHVKQGEVQVAAVTPLHGLIQASLTEIQTRAIANMYRIFMLWDLLIECG